MNRHFSKKDIQMVQKTLNVRGNANQSYSEMLPHTWI
jgi:hypothetical protein